uniref:3-hydroxyisobutyryl-CoA hydrolase-like protein 1, mitochondrial n=1 Tax=Erigeron canadensis TaxID=72917 RepID=UPI001CB8C131|nr:3-hydroxyisobutyryl-CoA hydrolase-like protein 1, mitochondrial [Erigeron canadensis]
MTYLCKEMQRFVRKYKCVRQCSQFFLRHRTRNFGNSSKSDHSVVVEGNANSRTVVLNRPSSLNALNTSMIKRLHTLYESWEDDPNVGFVVMKGNGDAFCAGGDILAMRNMIIKGDVEGSKEIFWKAYNLIYLLHTYLKPNVAILDGITMGGGVGISVLGTFQIVTNKTAVATPEATIGLHPDAGASFFLSRLPGYLGEFLALTGHRLNGVEMMMCGLATHYSHSRNIPLIEEDLRNLITNDPSVIKTTLDKYTDLDYPHNNSIFDRMETIDKCFGHDTVEQIIDALEREDAKTHDGWCCSVLKKLKYASPLILNVSLRSIREGRYQTLEECLIREYRLTLRAISDNISSDFCKGVRARMVDKDFTPKWDPPSLEHVSQDMVDHYFSPLGASEPELELPIRRLEASDKQVLQI